MRYRKASEVLPDNLLREVQKYVDGEALYFPKRKERKNWGEDSGARQYYKQRNDEIKRQYNTGLTVEALADVHNLSVESIRKIVYQ